LLRRLLVHTSRYSLGSFLTILASLVSFPFLTRVFSVADYGLMNLVAATLTLLTAVGKLGVQHAVVRLHKRTRAEDGQGYDRQVRSTAVLGMAGSGLVVALVWVLVVPFLPLDKLGIGALRGIFTLVAALIVLQVIDSAFVGLLRAEQRSGVLTTYQVLKKYLGLALIIGALVMIRRDLLVFYSAQIATEIAGAVFLGVVIFRLGFGSARDGQSAFSVPLYREMIRYGIPMMLGWEFAGIILSVGDRYLVQGFLGESALGLYAAAYNMCEYVEQVLLVPWGLAIMPIYTRLWEEGGEAQTRGFLGRSLRYYVLLGMPIVAGLSAIGPELLTLLAAEKYRDGARVIPAVVAGLVCAGAVPIVGAGVFIRKRTWVAARNVVLSTLLNLGLNWALLPTMGIQGAAIATLISYLLFLALMAHAGSLHLAVPIPWGLAARAAAAALAMYAILAQIHMSGRVSPVAIKVVLGVAVYGVLILAIEKTAREGVAAAMARIRE
jgi:O-antigen/teichoic acid export membrane protein